jgi:murein DD-endopeptidase MepM/ murein hydrolase activator NlpD
MRRLRGSGRASLLTCLITLPFAAFPAQTGYKYRDANGQWVFTDQAPDTGAPSDSFNLGHEKSALNIAVARVETADATQLTAVNECLCVATFELSLSGAKYRATLAPQSRQILAQVAHAQGAPAELQYAWKAALGSPQAMHTPGRPYRVPFAPGSTFQVTQAYPSHMTHSTPDSQYAVDIALPDDTPVYAAREGIVINARHDFFRTAMAPVMLDQANVVAILHDDGTIGIYAHLHWDSVRVRIGDHVLRGQYIADSGTTGFASGPHLHFAVIRNTGIADESVPVQFAGVGGLGVTPTTNIPLTSY